MEDTMKKYAAYGAYLGLFLCTAGLLNTMAGKVWNFISWITVIPGILLILAFVILRFDLVKQSLSMRSVKYGGNTLALILIVFCILGLINFIATRQSLRIDLTAGGQFSLSPQTKNVLKNLKQDVQVTSFVQPANERAIEDLFKSYRALSNRFHYTFIDPDAKPGIAKQYGITTYGTSVFESGFKVEKITGQEEQDFTNALIKVTREGQKVLYFLDGHGENDIENTERTGYDLARKAIEEENYDVQKLLLAEKKSIPEDCTVLVINGPKVALFQSELDTIQAFLQNGGKALFLLDPEPSFGFLDLLDRWGVSVGRDVVLDASGMGQLFGMGPSVPLVSTYETHEITRNFNIMTFYPHARSITPHEGVEVPLSVQKLLLTTPNSWGETDLSTMRASFNEGEDLKGPICVAAIVTKEEEMKKTRIVVVGDSDFANNTYFNVQGNGDLFLNTVSWLADEEDLISVRAKSPEDRRVSLTAKQIRWVMYGIVILMPLFALGTGIWIYIKREKR